MNHSKAVLIYNNYTLYQAGTIVPYPKFVLLYFMFQRMWINLKKNSNETQASHIFFFTLLFMLGIYEATCIEIPALSF